MKEKPDDPPLLLKKEWPQAQCVFWGLLLGTTSIYFHFQPGLYLAFLLLFFGMGRVDEFWLEPIQRQIRRESWFWGFSIRKEVERDFSDESLVFEIWKMEGEEKSDTRFEIRIKDDLNGYSLKSVSLKEEAIDLAEHWLALLGGSLRVMEEKRAENQYF